MKVFKNIVIWIVVAVYLLLVPAFTSDKSENIICKQIKIEITDSIGNRILNRNKMYNLLTAEDQKIIGTPLTKINTFGLEQKITELPEVKRADFYTTIDGILHVQIQQRKPVLKIMGNHIKGFYLDEEGEIIPVSAGYSSHVLIANGNIPADFSIRKINNINQFKGTEAKEHKILLDLHKIACFIYHNEFWSAQFEQIYVNGKEEIELVPRVGSHLILFGDINGYNEKFRKLYALYQVGFDYVSWNNYEKINLKYKNQVICTKR